jgi:hypothetical protein
MFFNTFNDLLFFFNFMAIRDKESIFTSSRFSFFYEYKNNILTIKNNT